MSTENIVSRVYRVLVGTNIWDRISFWNKASDTEAADGKSLEIKVGAIDGITSDTTSDSTTYAASIKTVHDLNNNLTTNLTANGNQFRFGYDSVSGKYGYILPDGEGGADSLHFFKSDIVIPEIKFLSPTSGTAGVTTNIQFDLILNCEDYSILKYTLGDTSLTNNGHEILIYGINENNESTLIDTTNWHELYYDYKVVGETYSFDISDYIKVQIHVKEGSILYKVWASYLNVTLTN